MSKYIVMGGGYRSPLLATLDRSVTLLEPGDKLTFLQDDKIYVLSEDALAYAVSYMKNESNIHAIHSFNNKLAFRQLLQPLYPDFYYSKCLIDALTEVSLNFNQSKKYIIKPDRGVFSSCVRIIDSQSNLIKISDELKNEWLIKSKLFPNTISSNFIIEEYIGLKADKISANFLENQEIAIDLFYDKHSKPIILSIYHHPYSNAKEYHNILYYLSYEVFHALYDKAMDFFEKLAGLVKMESLALHAEFKVISNTLMPIEINPGRFAGLGCADLIYHAFGINPFQSFFNEEKPDWNQVWKNNKKTYFAWVCGYNGSNLDVATHQPDHDLYKNHLGEIIAYQEMDHTSNPVFSIAYVKKNRKDELLDLCNMEFNHFLKSRDLI